MTQKYRNEDWLRQKYREEDLSQSEIANLCDIHQSTLTRWLDKYDIKKRHQDPELLRELYEERQMSTVDIADEFDRSISCINTNLRKCGIGLRKSNREKPPYLGTNQRGYEVLEHHDGENQRHVKLHRLVAVAEHGFDAVDGKVVHHQNGIPWDNRGQNLEPLTPQAHARRHHAA
jgi:transposase